MSSFGFSIQTRRRANNNNNKQLPTLTTRGHSTNVLMASEGGGVEDVVAKYKRLLSLARSSLEANQSSLATKDVHIYQLTVALEEEKARAAAVRRTTGRGDDALEPASIPRRLLRRIDVDEIIWVLVEYEGTEDSWICFGHEQELDDYIQRVPGVPLTRPPRCLSSAESLRVEEEAKKKVDRIVEEFRRYLPPPPTPISFPSPPHSQCLTRF